MGRPEFSWELGSRSLILGKRTLVMGVVNVTPDSFFDGGRYSTQAAALDQARRLIAEGADILDLGGESTRPRSDGVSAQEELERVVPVIRALAGETDLPLSIDTKKVEVARAALGAGASIINDISGGGADPAILDLAAESGCGLILMHMRGSPADMHTHTDYQDLLAEVSRELEASLGKALAAGVERESLVLDPGIGFAKRPTQNLRLIAGLSELAGMGYPLLMGPSRKSFIGFSLEAQGLPDGPGDRLLGTMASVALSAYLGAHILRVHDVAAARQVLAVADAIREGEFISSK